MSTRVLSTMLSLMMWGAGGCSLQTSDAAELGPRRESCTLGDCRECPCPGSVTPGYQMCDNRGYYVMQGTPSPGCTCPPYEVPRPPSCPPSGGAAGTGGS